MTSFFNLLGVIVLLFGIAFWVQMYRSGWPRFKGEMVEGSAREISVEEPPAEDDEEGAEE
jgi:hypothetical protein